MSGSQKNTLSDSQLEVLRRYNIACSKETANALLDMVKGEANEKAN